MTRREQSDGSGQVQLRGLRSRFSRGQDRGWGQAWPSNTAGIMRIIAEAPDRATAETKAASVRRVVDTILR